MSNDKDSVRVNDLFLAAYLQAIGFEFSKPPEKTSNRIVTFYFPKTKEVEVECAKFINRSGFAEALTLLEVYRNIKNIAFDVKKQEVE